MRQPDRKTVETVRDGAAARVVAARREEAPTSEMLVRRRKRYTIEIYDGDFAPPAHSEPNAPAAPLDL